MKQQLKQITQFITDFQSFNVCLSKTITNSHKTNDSILKEGKCSIQYSPTYLELPISKFMTFDKSHIALFKKYNINTIGSLSIVYSNEIKKAQQDEPIDKPFYQFLSQMSMSFIMRRELTSKIKYIMYMCS